MKTITKLLCFLGILVASQIHPSQAAEFMERPDFDRYPNPYQIMAEPSIKTKPETIWKVMANRTNMPLYRHADGHGIVHRGDYLELFQVIRRKGKRLEIQSIKRPDVQGWAEMVHLILNTKAITDPATGVMLKVFLKVRLDMEINREAELNSLRFRNGPGPGMEVVSDADLDSGHYRFLLGKDEVVREGTLFFYVFGIHFDNPGKNDKNYQDASLFKDADYFLIGESASFSQVIDIGPTSRILGWIPRSSAILWDTRQALETVPNRPPEHWEAHKFMKRPLLNHYFALSSQKKKQAFLNQHANEIVRDMGEGPPESGQELRDIVLSVGYEQREENGVVSENIGYTGRSGNSSQSAFLAQLQEGAKNLELFFLVDATRSMRPCLNAAASITEQVITRLEYSDVNIRVYGAVYRDASEGSQQYEEWDANGTQRIWKWFETTRAFSKSGDDYYESLFDAIDQAVDGWAARFKHPLSVRVLMILGDAGDASQDPSRLRSVIRKLAKHRIMPVAIHFQHPHFKPQDEGIESKAMAAFIDQLTEINKAFYNTSKWQQVQSIPEKALTGNLKKYVEVVAETVTLFIEKMPEVRRGQKSLAEALCEMAYSAKDPSLTDCKAACGNERDFFSFVQHHPPTNTVTDSGAGGGADIGIALAYLNALKDQNPKLWEYVMKRPEASFSEGFIALRNGDIEYTRPVLLLGLHELAEIQNSIQILANISRNCREADTHTLLVKAMTTLLGELLQTNPQHVSIEKLNQWLGTAIVGPGKSFLGVTEIVLSLCQHPEKFAAFLDKLETVNTRIAEMVNQRPRPKDRLYQDLHNYPYFWIYPEEIFPRPGKTAP